MYQEKVFISIEESSLAGFNAIREVCGENKVNLQYIERETGAAVTLRGRGSGFIEPLKGREAPDPLHLLIQHGSYEAVKNACRLAQDLVETVRVSWFMGEQQRLSSHGKGSEHSNASNSDLYHSQLDDRGRDRRFNEDWKSGSSTTERMEAGDSSRERSSGNWQGSSYGQDGIYCDRSDQDRERGRNSDCSRENSFGSSCQQQRDNFKEGWERKRLRSNDEDSSCSTRDSSSRGLGPVRNPNDNLNKGGKTDFEIMSVQNNPTLSNSRKKKKKSRWDNSEQLNTNTSNNIIKEVLDQKKKIEEKLKKVTAIKYNLTGGGSAVSNLSIPKFDDLTSLQLNQGELHSLSHQQLLEFSRRQQALLMQMTATLTAQQPSIYPLPVIPNTLTSSYLSASNLGMPISANPVPAPIKEDFPSSVKIGPPVNQNRPELVDFVNRDEYLSDDEVCDKQDFENHQHDLNTNKWSNDRINKESSSSSSLYPSRSTRPFSPRSSSPEFLYPTSCSPPSRLPSFGRLSPTRFASPTRQSPPHLSSRSLLETTASFDRFPPHHMSSERLPRPYMAGHRSPSPQISSGRDSSPKMLHRRSPHQFDTERSPLQYKSSRKASPQYIPSPPRFVPSPPYIPSRPQFDSPERSPRRFASPNRSVHRSPSPKSSSQYMYHGTSRPVSPMKSHLQHSSSGRSSSRHKSPVPSTSSKNSFRMPSYRESPGRLSPPNDYSGRQRSPGRSQLGLDRGSERYSPQLNDENERYSPQLDDILEASSPRWVKQSEEGHDVELNKYSKRLERFRVAVLNSDLLKLSSNDANEIKQLIDTEKRLNQVTNFQIEYTGLGFKDMVFIITPQSLKAMQWLLYKCQLVGRKNCYLAIAYDDIFNRYKLRTMLFLDTLDGYQPTEEQVLLELGRLNDNLGTDSWKVLKFNRESKGYFMMVSVNMLSYLKLKKIYWKPKYRTSFIKLEPVKNEPPSAPNLNLVY